MNTEEVKKQIEQNKEKLSLIFNSSVIMDIVDKENPIYSKKYRDADYSVFKFYKSMTRFK
jgi:hypothetical protein